MRLYLKKLFKYTVTIFLPIVILIGLFSIVGLSNYSVSSSVETPTINSSVFVVRGDKTIVGFFSGICGFITIMVSSYVGVVCCAKFLKNIKISCDFSGITLNEILVGNEINEKKEERKDGIVHLRI